jgi:hypothetical protein
MGWQARRGGVYFYHTRRLEGGRFRCDYIGNGHAGELAAALILIAQDELREARARRKAARQREKTVLEDLRRFEQLTGLLARATLLACGFHRHDRGTWRTRRHGPSNDA